MTHPVGAVIRWRSYSGEQVGRVLSVFTEGGRVIGYYVPGNSSPGPWGSSGPRLISAKDVIGVEEAS